MTTTTLNIFPIMLYVNTVHKWQNPRHGDRIARALASCAGDRGCEPLVESNQWHIQPLEGFPYMRDIHTKCHSEMATTRLQSSPPIKSSPLNHQCRIMSNEWHIQPLEGFPYLWDIHTRCQSEMATTRLPSSPLIKSPPLNHQCRIISNEWPFGTAPSITTSTTTTSTITTNQ